VISEAELFEILFEGNPALVLRAEKQAASSRIRTHALYDSVFVTACPVSGAA
jgi:hypothetical protein